MAGIVVGEHAHYSTVAALVSFLVGVIALLMHRFSKGKSFFLYQKEIILQTSFSLAVAIFCTAFVFGVVRVQFEKEIPKFICTDLCTFEGRVRSSPKYQDTYQTFDVLPLNEGVAPLYVRVRTVLHPAVHVGDELVLSGRVMVPKINFKDDDVKQFDYNSYLLIHGVGSEMIYPKVEEKILPESSKSFSLRLQKIKEYFIEIISQYVGSPAESLAGGMLLGNSSMSGDLTKTFRTAGLSHVVVLSGFNIAILISFILFVGMVLPLFLRVALALLVVIFFVLMVGAEVSIIRAMLMSCISLVALFMGRAYSARQALLVSLIAIILYEPKSLFYDVSLHLSFLATAGIIYLQEPFLKIFKGIKIRSYQEVLATTLAAYIATLPYIMYTFGTISLYALLANALALPLVPCIMFITFLLVIFAPYIHGLGLIIGYVDTVLCGVVIYVARFFEGLPGASVSFSISYASMILLYILIVITFLYTKKEEVDETLLTKDDELISPVMSY